MIGSLIYLTSSRPDIMFVVSLCACFQANPKESCLNAAKCIMRYLLSTRLMGSWYSKGTNCTLVGYSDSGFVWYSYSTFPF